MIHNPDSPSPVPVSPFARGPAPEMSRRKAVQLLAGTAAAAVFVGCRSTIDRADDVVDGAELVLPGLILRATAGLSGVPAAAAAIAIGTGALIGVQAARNYLDDDESASPEEREVQHMMKDGGFSEVKGALFKKDRRICWTATDPEGLWGCFAIVGGADFFLMETRTTIAIGDAVWALASNGWQSEEIGGLLFPKQMTGQISTDLAPDKPVRFEAEVGPVDIEMVPTEQEGSTVVVRAGELEFETSVPF